MQDLIDAVIHKTGLAAEKAKAAVEAVLGQLKARLRAPWRTRSTSSRGAERVGMPTGWETSPQTRSVAPRGARTGAAGRATTS